MMHCTTVLSHVTRIHSPPAIEISSVITIFCCPVCLTHAVACTIGITGGCACGVCGCMYWVLYRLLIIINDFELLLFIFSVYDLIVYKDNKINSLFLEFFVSRMLENTNSCIIVRSKYSGTPYYDI